MIDGKYEGNSPSYFKEYAIRISATCIDMKVLLNPIEAIGRLTYSLETKFTYEKNFISEMEEVVLRRVS